MHYFLKAILVISLFLLLSCSKVNRDNYDSIENGMTLEEVSAILGEPDEKSTRKIGDFSTSAVAWKTDEVTIVVTLINNKTTLKTFTENTDTKK